MLYYEYDRENKSPTKQEFVYQRNFSMLQKEMFWKRVSSTIFWLYKLLTCYDFFEFPWLFFTDNIEISGKPQHNSLMIHTDRPNVSFTFDNGRQRRKQKVIQIDERVPRREEWWGVPWPLYFTWSSIFFFLFFSLSRSLSADTVLIISALDN